MRTIRFGIVHPAIVIGSNTFSYMRTPQLSPVSTVASPAVQENLAIMATSHHAEAEGLLLDEQRVDEAAGSLRHGSRRHDQPPDDGIALTC